MFHLLTKENGKLEIEALRPTLFVPMTGEAEKRRQRPARPRQARDPKRRFRGSRRRSGRAGRLALSAATGGHSTDRRHPSGKRYVDFRNDTPGRGCQALQGFAVDGRQVKELQVSLWVRGQEIRPAAWKGSRCWAFSFTMRTAPGRRRNPGTVAGDFCLAASVGHDQGSAKGT